MDQKYKLGLGKKTHGAQLVSVVKSELRGPRPTKRTVRKRKPAEVSGGLDAAVAFVVSAGGLDAARAQLDKLEEIKRAL